MLPPNLVAILIKLNIDQIVRMEHSLPRPTLLICHLIRHLLHLRLIVLLHLSLRTLQPLLLHLISLILLELLVSSLHLRILHIGHLLLHVRIPHHLSMTLLTSSHHGILLLTHLLLLCLLLLLLLLHAFLNEYLCLFLGVLLKLHLDLWRNHAWVPTIFLRLLRHGLLEVCHRHVLVDGRHLRRHACTLGLALLGMLSLLILRH